MKNLKVKKLKFKSGEKCIVLPIRKTPGGNKYAITNHGRVVSYTTSPAEGIFLKPGKIGKYRGASVGRKTYLIHRLVALHFVKKTGPNQVYVIHLNYDGDDNHFRNLRWASRQEVEEHLRKNPKAKKRGNQKLTVERVKEIKEKIQESKMTLKMIGNKFGVTDMQIHRIKTGENWGYVKILKNKK